MTPERFHQIVEAYGADPQRWPQQERAAAERWAAAHRVEADTALAAAVGIDAWLAADKVEPPGMALQQRIIDSAPVRRPSSATPAIVMVGRGGGGRRTAGRRGRRFCGVVFRYDGGGSASARVLLLNFELRWFIRRLERRMNGRSWKIVLMASLVLNVFLLGAIVGGAYQWFAAHGRDRGVVVAQQRTALRFAAEPLPAERQKAFVDGLKNARRDGRQFAREGREGRRDVLRLLAAPQFDRTALDAAPARTREADSSLRAKVEDSVADFAATLSPEERVAFAESLKLRGQWREPQLAVNTNKPAKSGNAAASDASSDASGE